MRALISQRLIVDNYGVACDQMESNYIEYFENLGYDCYLVSNYANKKWWEEQKFELVVLTGGGTVPSCFFEESKNSESFSKRDCMEIGLIEYARGNKIPVIGICRGMQFINGYMGGKVSKLDNLKTVRPIRVDHAMTLDGNKFMVNNYHNDGIFEENLSKKLCAIGVDSENNVVECYKSNNEKILGIQWHPERKFQNNESKIASDDLILNFLRGGL